MNLLITTLATVIAMSTGTTEHTNFFHVNEDVLAWIPLIHAVRDEMGLSAAKYSDALVLALIHRESKPFGSEYSHTEGTRYYGALQMADSYVVDASEKLGIDALPAKKIMGEPELQLRLFFAYNERYKVFHGLYRPSYVALMHKVGVGTMAADDVKDKGRSAKVIAAEHSPFPEAVEYINSWQKLQTIYAEWIEVQNKKLGICASGEYAGPYHSKWRKPYEQREVDS